MIYTPNNVHFRFRSSDANGLSELLAIADVLKQGREESNRNEGADSGLMEQVKGMLETLAHRKNRRPLILLNILFLVMIFSGKINCLIIMRTWLTHDLKIFLNHEFSPGRLEM